MSNFAFARASWPEIAHEARHAEGFAFADPRSSVFYSRRTLELIVQWLYRADGTLTRPYKDDLSSLLFEPTFKQLVTQRIHTKMDLIRKQGNAAVHRVTPVSPQMSVAVVGELFHILTWLATGYAPTVEDRPASDAQFDVGMVPRPQPGAVAKSQAQIKDLADQLAARDLELADARSRNDAVIAERDALVAEVATWKARNATVPDTHDYREDETRDRFIDVLLRESGWNVEDPRAIEFPVTGMPNSTGEGFVDYVLWGDDGMPLGLVEAKRTRKDAIVGQNQAKLYADALERQFGQRPVIFYTNGYEHVIWDDASYAPRAVQGFYTREQLALVIQRRSTRRPLATLSVDSDIAGRHYQQRAVRRVAEAFEQKERRALLVMATGSGKTRTVIALADLMIRANWAKRILFLADRIALVNQATNAFKAQLPDSAPVNLVTEKDIEGRVFVSTYPTMMGLIDQGEDGLRCFGPGYFDLIVIDEAHRSVYQKYGAIFEYFDALLVGLTATPKDEIDHNTYGLFNLEDGVPTDSYGLTEAIEEGYLVPPVGRAVATRFVREGIRYDDLDEADKEAWDLLDWEDGVVPAEIESTAMMNWLFNADTVDKVLETLMTEGRKVAGGDILGKTVVFARSMKHAEFIATRFDLAYPQYAGHFAQVVTYQTSYVLNAIDRFSQTDSYPQIAISVDMLDTGIDIPDIVNLVFFKPVHSKTKYWQMVGRGTRLRPDLFGPGDDKRDFVIFDVCQNIEYFNEDLPGASSTVSASLGSRLFTARLSLIGALDAAVADDADLSAIRHSTVARLHSQVEGMSLDNFLVRTRRREVERFADPVAWMQPTGDDLIAASQLAGLPSADDVLDTDEQAKRFDLFALRAQLGVLAGDPGFAAARRRMQAIANALAEQRAIPIVASNIELIAAVASDEWWTDVTVPMLEMARIRLRGLVSLIDSKQRALVYTDFTDETAVSDVDLVLVAPAVDRARFKEKAFAFLREHEDDVVLFKLRHGHQLTALDLSELERILRESGQFSAIEIESMTTEGLGYFVRSLVGMDRSAAADALSAFTADTTLTGNQLAFVNLVVDQLTRSGVVEPARLYEAPFTGVAPTGPDGLFTSAQVTTLVAVLRHIRATAGVG